ncbi:MAG: hypothetical protein JSV64_07950 [Candidatus Bathyarchaeota archaeon]|nr:MAG: hypothetical protein JSV64_07950 [Candidatus Bathyarchaeota archaeon]
MREKKTSTELLTKIQEEIEADTNLVDWTDIATKIRVKNMTQKERMQEARKPLYLKRYE